ncbi:12123_t:CDS:1 [Ambispora gerdemannii]|uniref:12123_t:CDS:1 n=1 Tax=Ambispora gerdemannii TaxID=144530 RepID=A0A9N9AJ74_9GLOM|nr:12123_t:CDS:1 [Ambispora gerdemannii]
MVCMCFVCGGPASTCLHINVITKVAAADTKKESFTKDNEIFSNNQQPNKETESESESESSDSERRNEQVSLYDQLDEYEKASMLLEHVSFDVDCDHELDVSSEYSEAHKDHLKSIRVLCPAKWTYRGLSSCEFDGIPPYSNTFTTEVLNFDEPVPRVLTHSVIVDFESWAECVFNNPLSDYADGFGLLVHQNCFIMLDQYLSAWCRANFPEDDKPIKDEREGKYRVNYVEVFRRLAREIIDNNYRFNVLNHETMNYHFKTDGKFECNESEAWKISNPIYIPDHKELNESSLVLSQLTGSFFSRNLGEFERIPNEVLGLLAEILVWTGETFDARDLRAFISTNKVIYNIIAGNMGYVWQKATMETFNIPEKCLPPRQKSSENSADESHVPFLDYRFYLACAKSPDMKNRARIFKNCVSVKNFLFPEEDCDKDDEK